MRDEASQRAQERIVQTAYDLFSRRGIRDVGIDELIAQAGVAKATFYHHFRSNDDLVVAFLERREERWTKEWVENEARRRGSTPEECLLAIFNLFDERFRREDFEGCSFSNVLLEMRAPTSRRAGERPTPREHPGRGPSPRGGGGAASSRRLRSILAHLHERVDRPGG